MVRMEILKELLTLLQLTSLLFLFYWSATWNLPPNFDSIVNPGGSRPPEILYPEGFSGHSIAIDSFKSVRSDAYKALRVLSFSKTPPPFEAWKEEELTKQDVKEEKKGWKHHRRKLNYASSKCGAKILSSNPEASFRMSILNEKIDEYMLNPCQADSRWFVIELCDAIEATQIELANYELFSSSPRRFSSYWSDVYPTQKWQPLGTFEAKDQRSTQTFDITERNLGKFVKVVISSYYGKEHFCLLSVFRVLGYSMIYEFDSADSVSIPKNHVFYKEKEGRSKLEYNRSLRLSKDFDSHNTRANIQKEGVPDKNSMQMCLQSSLSKSNICLNDPICLFLHLKPRHLVQIHKKIEAVGVCPLPFRFENQMHQYPRHEPKTCKSIDYFLRCIILSRKFDSGGMATKHQSGRTFKKVAPVANTTNDENGIFSKQDGEDDVISESATLLQKESVLSKLTHRIKASEMSLNLINRYLQRLSESYRQQMEDMQIMFNGTIKAISLASRKAEAIDEQQQTSLEKLEETVNSLNERVEYFASGQENLLKQFLELHAFFLILEFIIVSTLFSIFVNNFKKRISLLEHPKWKY